MVDVGRFNSCYLYIAKNGIELVRLYGSGGDVTGSNMVVLMLQEGDTVSVHRGDSNCQLNGDTPYNTFSGFKFA